MAKLIKSAEKVSRYEFGEFYVDIVDGADDYEAWITGKRYGVSSLMFGIPKKNQFHGVEYTESKRSFLAMVESNLDFEIAAYINEYYVEYEGEEPRLYALKPGSGIDKQKLGITEADTFTFREFCELAIAHNIPSNGLFNFFREVQ